MLFKKEIYTLIILYYAIWWTTVKSECLLWFELFSHHMLLKNVDWFVWSHLSWLTGFDWTNNQYCDILLKQFKVSGL